MNVSVKKNSFNCRLAGISRYIPLSLIFLLVLIFYFPIIFDGRTFYPFDILFSYLPWSTFIENFYPQNLLLSDPVNAYYPPHFYSAHHYYQEALKSGSLNFWFQYIFSGLPYIYYGYPFSYLFFSIFPIPTAHDFFLFIHLFGTGLFTYLYLKKIGLSRFPSTIGAISWMFNGYVMVWFEFEHVPMLSMALSATLLCVEYYLEKRNALRFLCLVFAISLTINTFYAHLIIYQLLFVGAYILFRLGPAFFFNRSNFKNGLKIFAGMSCAICASIVISTYFFTTHILLLKSGQRKTIPYNELYKKTGQLPAKYFLTMLFPDLFGSPASNVTTKFKGQTPVFTPKVDKNQKYNNYNELCIYAGIIPILLALFCSIHFRKRRFIQFFLISFLMCLLIAMGSVIYYPLYKFIPGLDLSTPTRILYLFGFSISILAAFGAQILNDGKTEKKKLAAFLWMMIMVAAGVLIVYLQTEHGRKWLVGPYYLNKWKHYHDVNEILGHYLGLSSNVIIKPMLGITSAVIILLCLLYAKKDRYKYLLFSCLIMLLCYDLIAFGRIYNPASSTFMEFPPTAGIRLLKKDTEKFRIMTFGSFLPNAFTSFGIENIGGYGSFYPRRYGEYLYKSQYGSEVNFPETLGRWTIFETFGSPLLDLLNTKYILTPPEFKSNSNRLKLIYEGEITIYQNLLAFKRAFFVHGYTLAENEKDAYIKIGHFSRNDFINKVILESPPDENILIPDTDITKNSLSKVTILNYSSDKITIEVSTGRPGFLVISDNYHPDWVASVDGKTIQVLRANYIMRAIPMTAGNHIVILEFKPKILLAGFFTTIIGWLILIILILYFTTKTAYSHITANSMAVLKKK